MFKRTAAICLAFLLIMAFSLTGTAHAEDFDMSLPPPQGVTVGTGDTSFLVGWENTGSVEELALEPYNIYQGVLFYLVDWRVNGGPWHYDREIPAGQDIVEYYPDILNRLAGSVYDYNNKRILSQVSISKVVAGVPYTTPVKDWLEENSVEFRIRYIHSCMDEGSGEIRHMHSPFSAGISIGTPNPAGDKDPKTGMGQSGMPAPPVGILAPEELKSENMTLNIRWKVPEDIKTLDDTGMFYVYAVIDWKLNNGEWHDGVEAYESDITNVSLVKDTEYLYRDSHGYVSTSIDPKALDIPSGVSLSSWLADKTYSLRARYLLEVPEENGVRQIFSSYSNTTFTGMEAGGAANGIIDSRAERLWGDDRYRTAAAISKKGWERSDSVILVDGDNFPDALVGSSFAYLKNAPVLITGSDSLNSDTRTEINRLGASTIYILGSYDSISKAVEDELKRNFTVIRIGGTGVFDTAVKVGEEVRKLKQFNTVAIATRNDFPDALAIAPFSARDTIPILFSEKDSLRADTKKALQDWGIEHVIISGGPGVVSDNVENDLKAMGISVERLWGQDRYATAREVALRFETQYGHGCISIATGRDYPDALTGAVFAAKNNSPIFLADKDYMDAGVIEYINVQPIERIYIFGGTGVVSDSVINQIGK